MIDPIKRTRTTRPWWTHAKFGMRVLIVSVLLIGGWLGWLAHRARVQREAIAAIKQAGGSLVYNRQTNSNAPWWPKWLEDFIGVDNLDHIVLVNLRSDDAMLVHVGHLDHLEKLSLEGSLVSDSGLVHLEGLTKLQWLYLGETKIGDAGLDHLKGLTELRRLILRNTSITDAGLQSLKRLTNLEELEIGGTKVTEAGLQELQKALPKLKIIR